MSGWKLVSILIMATLFVCLPLWAGPEDEEDLTTPPHPWDRVMNDHQALNTERREKEVFEEPSEKLYHFDLPSDELDITRSDYLDRDPDLKRQVIIEKTVDGVTREYTRVFFRKKSEEDFAHIRKWLAWKEIPLEQEYYAKRTNSRASYLVWHKRDRARMPFFLKFRSAELGEEAVHNNDYLEASFDELGAKDARILPERLAVSTIVGGIELGYSTRSVLPAGAPLPENTVLYPLHSFLAPGDDSLLTKSARIRGLDRQTYAEKLYIPRLARAMAEFHHRHHWYPADHTQNLWVAWNHKTRKIEGIVASDLPDGRTDLIGRRAAGKAIGDKVVAAGGTKQMLPERVTRQAIELSWQSIRSFESDREWRDKYTDAYLEHYVAAAREYSGLRLTLPRDFQEKAAELAKGTKPPSTKTDLRYDGERLALGVAKLSVAQRGLYDAALERRLELKEVPHRFHRGGLARLFHRAELRRQDTLLDPNGPYWYERILESGLQITAPRGNLLVAYDADQIPRQIAYGFYPAELEEIRWRSSSKLCLRSLRAIADDYQDELVLGGIAAGVAGSAAGTALFMHWLISQPPPPASPGTSH